MVSRDRIVIGASAGGVAALRELVSRLPADLPAAVFVTLHLFERSEVTLPAILNAAGPLVAGHAEEGEVIRPGRIYVAPPDHHLLLDADTVHLGHGPREGLQRPSINVMFRSAAAAFGERVTGVVLTGLLDDGAAGLWEIQQHGGAAIVQDPDEAAYRSMPESAIRGVNVQYILRLAEMAPLLAKLSMGDHRVEPNLPTPMKATLTEQACPECGGVMSMEQRGGTKEYICHVGHRLGLQTMIAEKSARVERAMWTALAQSEELLSLLRASEEVVDVPAPRSLHGEIEHRLRDLATLRRLLQGNELGVLGG